LCDGQMASKDFKYFTACREPLDVDFSFHHSFSR
jgi:hypothetical protein